MTTDPNGLHGTISDIAKDRRITRDRIENLIQNLGYDTESADYNVVMEDMVPPTTDEAMMSKRAEAHERRLVVDAIIRETPSHPPIAIYSPKEEDMERIAILPADEPDEIGRESTARLWLHMASEVSKAKFLLLVSPAIISTTGTDTPNQHFHLDDFERKDAQEIINIVANQQ